MTEETSAILFDPLGGLPVWGGVIALFLLAALLLIMLRKDSWVWRIVALAGLVLWMGNPQKVTEIRQPLDDVVGIIVDDSQSMSLAGRESLRDEMLTDLEKQLARFDNLDIRVLRLTGDEDTGSLVREKQGTRLVRQIPKLYEDISSDRVAATFIITDGQVHDVPDGEVIAPLPFADAPVHVLLTGKQGETDRQLVLEKAPRYGLIGKDISYRFMVRDLGQTGDSREKMARVRIDADGADPRQITVPVNTPIDLEARIRHGNQNHVVLTVDPMDDSQPDGGEISLANNQAIMTVNGIRDRLKVLLISGQPYAGERVWRNLLKADPAVDLVHFTILRPLSKRDDAADNEVSLIGFPVRQLFDQTVDDFDLILFDRYRRHGVIAPAYFRNIADYVRGGGSLMIAAGPDFASPLSITRTPLDTVIPVTATGEIGEYPFKPGLTSDGKRHPVTASLSPDGTAEQEWADWYRLIGAQIRQGQELMDDGNGNPLLVVDRVEDGRIAVLLSDHAWIWARGIEGGGPYIELLRRTAHWLMQEPELEEEKLSAIVENGQLSIQRRSMQRPEGEATITLPDGSQTVLALTESKPGRVAAQMPADQPGIYKVKVGDRIVSAASGILNPKEVLDLVANDQPLATLTADSKGGSFYTGDRGLPEIGRLAADNDSFARNNYAAIRRTDSALITGTSRNPLIPAPLYLVWIGAFLMLAWYRESRGKTLF